MRPSDRDYIAAMCWARGVASPYWRHTSDGIIAYWRPRGWQYDALYLLGRRIVLAGRTLGEFVGRGWRDRLVDAVERELRSGT